MNILVMGAGQLARMMALAGAPLNLKVTAYDVNSDKIVDPVSNHVFALDLANAVAQADVVTS